MMNRKLCAVCLSFGIIAALGMTGCGKAIEETPTPADSAEAVVTEESSEAAEPAAESESGEPADAQEQTKGSTWELVTESKVDFPVFTAQMYDEKMGMTVGQAGKVFYTHDGGASWTKAANDSACRFGMDILNGSVVYTCGNQSEVTKSTDKGMNFTKMTEFGESEPKQCTMMSFCDENTGMAASKGKLGFTTDGAVTWTEVTAPCSIMAVRMVDAQNFYVLGEGMLLYETKDAGANWEETRITLPLGEDYYFDLNNVVFSVEGEDSYTFYLIQDSEKHMRSYSTTDGGATFTENTMPDTKMPNVPRLATVTLNQPGDVLTVYNLGKSTVLAFKRAG